MAVTNIVQGVPHHLWYLYMTLGLYFVTPFLHLLVSGSQLGGLRLLIIGSFIISSIEYVFGGRSVTFLLYVKKIPAGREALLLCRSFPGRQEKRVRVGKEMEMQVEGKFIRPLLGNHHDQALFA